VDGRVFITDIVSDSVTTALKITPGLEITAFDGYPTVAWLSEHRRAQPASNEWTRQRAITQQMSRGRPSDVVMKVRDANNRERTITVPRTGSYHDRLPAMERPAASLVRELGNGIGYVDVERLTDASLASALPAALTGRGLILDLRGTLHIDDRKLLQRLATRPQSVVGRIVQRTLTAPCFASIREATIACADVRESRGWQRDLDTSAVYRGRVVVLIDERTQGAMERLAMSLEQVADITFIGSASAGAVSWTTPLLLPGGMQVGIATQELRRADGGQVQRVGLTPLVEVRPTVRGVRAGDDEVLTRAQQWLQQQLDPPVRRRR
jgi:C-terminal processing protease CtpA/Prc